MEAAADDMDCASAGRSPNGPASEGVSRRLSSSQFLLLRLRDRRVLRG